MSADPKPFTGRGPFLARGTFHAGSLQNRVRQFFLANPDEELTYPDMCVKFDCTLEQAHGAVRELVKRDGDKAPVTTVHLVRGKKVSS